MQLADRQTDGQTVKGADGELHGQTIIMIIMMIMRMAAISTAPYATDKGEHAALYQINTNVHIKTAYTLEPQQ